MAKTGKENKINDTSQAELADLMMMNIVQLGKFSYELEEKREQSLINQSSNMLTAFSIFSAVVFVVMPIVIDYTDVNVYQLLLCIAVVSVFLVGSLVLSVLSQWRFKYKTMTDINDFFTQVNKEHQKYCSQAQFDMQWKDQLSQIQSSKKINNDMRSNLIIASMILFIIAIFTVAVSVFLLLFLHGG